MIVSNLWEETLPADIYKIWIDFIVSQKFPAEHSRFFPQALLCGFSKLQLQTQATAQVGKSHSGRSRVQILPGTVMASCLTILRWIYCKYAVEVLNLRFARCCNFKTRVFSSKKNGYSIAPNQLFSQTIVNMRNFELSKPSRFTVFAKNDFCKLNFCNTFHL